MQPKDDRIQLDFTLQIYISIAGFVECGSTPLDTYGTPLPMSILLGINKTPAKWPGDLEREMELRDSAGGLLTHWMLPAGESASSLIPGPPGPVPTPWSGPVPNDFTFFVEKVWMDEGAVSDGSVTCSRFPGIGDALLSTALGKIRDVLVTELLKAMNLYLKEVVLVNPGDLNSEATPCQIDAECMEGATFFDAAVGEHPTHTTLPTVNPFDGVAKHTGFRHRCGRNVGSPAAFSPATGTDGYLEPWCDRESRYWDPAGRDGDGCNITNVPYVSGAYRTVGAGYVPPGTYCYPPTGGGAPPRSPPREVCTTIPASGVCFYRLELQDIFFRPEGLSFAVGDIPGGLVSPPLLPEGLRDRFGALDFVTNISAGALAPGAAMPLTFDGYKSDPDPLFRTFSRWHLPMGGVPSAVRQRDRLYDPVGLSYTGGISPTASGSRRYTEDPSADGIIPMGRYVPWSSVSTYSSR